MKLLKTKLLSTTLISFTLLSSITLAQNIKTEIQANSIQNEWTGLYGGFNFGGIFNDVDLKSQHLGLIDPTDTCNIDSNFSSFFPGAQLGYLRQIESNFMLGIEGDFTYNVNQIDKVSCNCPFTPGVSDRYSIKNRLQASIRGRLGYSINSHILSFISVGGSFADLGMTYSNESGDYYSTNASIPGWLVGAGFEWGFFHTWSIRAEYYYVDYNNINMSIPNIYGLYDPNGNAYANISSNNVRLVINHWF